MPPKKNLKVKIAAAKKPASKKKAEPVQSDVSEVEEDAQSTRSRSRSRSPQAAAAAP